MPRHGHPMSAAARAAESRRMTGKKHPHKGHALSSATRAKLSAARKGKAHPHKGHAMTAETRAKIAAALRAHYAALTQRGKKTVRAVAGGRRPNAKSLAALRRPRKARGTVNHAPKLSRAHHTHKFQHGAHRLISAHTYHKRTGLIHPRRKHRTRIRIRRTVRHHRVWRKRKRR
jgi:hypothetical protein